MRRAAVLAAAVVAFFGSDRDASAAATARLDVFPAQPRVGELVTVQLRTYWTYTDRTPPAVFDIGYRMRVRASGPRGRTLAVPLVQDARNPHVWHATLRFPAGGTWAVCGTNWQEYPRRRCAPTNPTRTGIVVRSARAAVDEWHRLQRPLNLPSVEESAPCPTTAAAGSLGWLGSSAPAWGLGPAYPVGLGFGETPRLRLDPIPPQSLFYGSAWLGQKVLWLIDRGAYHGPILIRGRQLDGPDRVRFDEGLVPPRETRIGPFPAAEHGSLTRVRAPGCYAYQVDGLTFSYTIVFEARPA